MKKKVKMPAIILLLCSLLIMAACENPTVKARRLIAESEKLYNEAFEAVQTVNFSSGVAKLQNSMKLLEQVQSECANSDAAKSMARGEPLYAGRSMNDLKNVLSDIMYLAGIESDGLQIAANIAANIKDKRLRGLLVMDTVVGFSKTNRLPEIGSEYTESPIALTHDLDLSFVNGSASGDPRFAIAKSYLEIGMNELALRSMEGLLEWSSSSKRYIYPLYAEILMRAGNAKKADDYLALAYSDALSDAKRSDSNIKTYLPVTLSFIGLSAWEMGKTEESKKFFSLAKEYAYRRGHEGLPWGFENLGEMGFNLAKAGMVEDALRAFSAARQVLEFGGENSFKSRIPSEYSGLLYRMLVSGFPREAKAASIGFLQSIEILCDAGIALQEKKYGSVLENIRKYQGIPDLNEVRFSSSLIPGEELLPFFNTMLDEARYDDVLATALSIERFPEIQRYLMGRLACMIQIDGSIQNEKKTEILHRILLSYL